MPETQRRLFVLVALDDAASSEQLALRLSEHDGLLLVTAEDLADGDHADVAIVGDETAGGARIQGAPLLVLSSRATRRPAAVAAVLPRDADTALIAAAARLAAAGYRITQASAEMDGRGASFGTADDRLGGGLLTGGEADHEASAIRLSPREAEVLALLAEGASNKVIARHLDISVHTAKFHVAAILTKLGAANRTDAIATAMRQGLVLV
ncbi:helix-turn-helix transcriptional regulator [Pseudaminobacter soli (ex Li et al. 2025)]|uniref:Helix-turn-helix transcriptional regulator n=1 Tax=Pseudaminobacter soli (ex Li et al. 2025) TaxID=1295366 RepID=A0A2P7SJZ2_9HYPH|nr:helix-turn-helix transcriptional regulator [Mesorhizobium soli]PSJ62809.1 helix-turn-helix transcriptional regulator [Mesorhizobium soli]